MEGIEPSEVATSQSMVAPCAPRHFISKRVITFMSNDARARLPRFRLLNIRSRYFRRYGLCRTAHEHMVFVSFLGLSGVLSFATFRVVHACPSEVTSPLTRNLGFGERIRTSMGSYPVYPRTASPLRYHTRHLCTLLIWLICLYFAFHVAAVSSFTTLISLLHLTAVRLVIEHCPRSHTQTFKEGFMCLTENLGFGFPSASFRSKLYLSSLTTLTSRLVSKVEGR